MHHADRRTHIAHRPRYVPRRSAGFTLLEALLASAVLAFVVAALMHAIVAGQTQTYYALHESRAVTLAEATLDELLSGPYSELHNTWHDFEQPDPNDDEGDGEFVDAYDVRYGEPYQKFTLHVSVSNEQTFDVQGLGELIGRQITITVNDDRHGQWVVQRFVRKPSVIAPPNGSGQSQNEENESDDEMYEEDPPGNGGGPGNGNGPGNGGGPPWW